MENFIYAYLTENFYLKQSSVGNYGIYRIDDSNIYPYPRCGEKILNELNLIFGMTKDENFDILNKWCLKEVEGVDLKFYWRVDSEKIKEGNFHENKPGKLPETLYMKYLNYQNKLNLRLT